MHERVALVTGGSRGIGRAVAIALAGRGLQVAINYRERADDAKRTLAHVEKRGAGGMCVQADIESSREVNRLFSEIEAELGTIEVLVNNAGVRADGLVVRMSDDQWEKVLGVNLFGAFACSRRALRPMIRGGWGRIVNVSSVAGLHGSPGQANYSAAKAGLIGFSRALAREVARTPITVNCVAPGLIDTDLTSTLNDRQLEVLVSQIPKGRAGSPEDVAAFVAWLCSEEASYITGGVFPIDGGMSA